MYIVIAGAGLIGGQLAEHLVRARHDVVVIDHDKEHCERLYTDLGVVSVNGSATDIRVVQDAGIERADVSAALMQGDAENMAFTLLATQFGVKQRIVRMRDPRYEEAYELAGATFVLRVSDLMMHELIPAIESPVARRIAEIGGGVAEMVAITVPEGAQVAGKTITEVVQGANFPEACAFAAILDQEGRITIPRGDARIDAGHEVLVVSKTDDLPSVIKSMTE